MYSNKLLLLFYKVCNKLLRCDKMLTLINNTETLCLKTRFDEFNEASSRVYTKCSVALTVDISLTKLSFFN